MRMVYNVINEIAIHIPEEAKYDQLHNELARLTEETLYKAPEQMPEYFGVLGGILEKHLGEPDEDWKKEIARIMWNDGKVSG